MYGDGRPSAVESHRAPYHLGRCGTSRHSRALSHGRDRPTRAELMTLEGKAHPVRLREVTIERYVHRLRLEAKIPNAIFNLLERCTAMADRPLLKAIARRTIWDDAGRRGILERFLMAEIGPRARS